MAQLNRNNSNWSFEERRKINENWDILESMANSTANGNNGVKQELEELKITVGQNTTRSNGAFQLANQAKQESSSVLGVANNAVAEAQNALEIANSANAKSDNAIIAAENSNQIAETVREQFDLIVAESGSSNPEVVASRTDSINGQNFSSLPQRLDMQRAELETQIESKVEKNTVVVYAKDFGVKADYNLATGEGTDDTTALQAALNFARNAGGVELILPVGRIKITRSLTITTSFFKLTGQGFATEIVYDGDVYNSATNPNADAVLKIGSNGNSVPRVIIEKVSFHGGNKAQWAVKVDASSGVTFRDVRFRRSFGHLYATNSPLLNVDNCVFEYNTPTRPANVTVNDWNFVKNTGLISLLECHGCSFNQYFIYGPGHDELDPLRAAVYINSTVSARFEGGVIERDAQYLAGTQADNRSALRQVFYVTNLVRNLKIENVYCEHINALNFFASVSISNFNMSLKNIYLHLSSYYNFPFNIASGGNFNVGDVYMWGTYVGTDVMIGVPAGLSPNPINGRFVWYKGMKGGVHNRVLINGKTYGDPGVIDYGLAITNGQVVSDGDKLVRVTSGFEVNQGSDSIGQYIAVTDGTLTNNNGDNIEVGLPLNDTVRVGWIFRVPMTAGANYSVCVDASGGVWVESAANAKNNNTGKAIIARFVVDNELKISSLVANANLFRGNYINDAANKLVYSSAIPASGFWNKGDRFINISGNVGSITGAVCTVGGNPGVWNSLGTLQ